MQNFLQIEKRFVIFWDITQSLDIGRRISIPNTRDDVKIESEALFYF